MGGIAGFERARRGRVAMVIVILACLAGTWTGSVAGAAKTPVSGGPTTDPWNDRLAVQVAADGRFNLGAFPNPLDGSGTDCDTATPACFSLSYEWPDEVPDTSYTTVRVDGIDVALGAGHGDQADPTSPPMDSADHLSNTTGYLIGSTEDARDVAVTQQLDIVDNPLTGETDLARITYTLSNTSATVSHEVGTRVMIDTDVDQNDDAPFRVPGLGPVTTEQDLLGAAIPSFFDVFFDLSDATKVGAALLKGSGATTPDRVVLGTWQDTVDHGLYVSPWDYTTTPGLDLGDSAYAVYWNPTTLAPGQTRSYTTFYGLGEFDVVTGPPLQLGIVAPSSLSVSDCAYDPNPFDVVATVENIGDGPATGVTATIALPVGMTLATGTATQSLPDLAAVTSAQVTWQVSVADQASASTKQIEVTATANEASPLVGTRLIDVPAACSPLSVSKSVAESQVSVGGSAVYTITVTNPNAVDVVLDSITDTLPLGFAHVAGSTSGATTADPSVADEVLTWTGPFTVPASRELTLTFSASVGTTAGTFTNQADATATPFTVTGSGPTAAVTVVANPTLSVGVTGSGSVSSSPAGIACPGTCSAPFASSTEVTLTATPDTGSVFSGWSGGGCSDTPTCVVTLSADTAVTATFDAPECPPAPPSVVLDEEFESGACGWVATGFWHVQDHPETISVKAPEINPTLVTLPDSGQLPSAVSGTHVAWYGEAATGTFCGTDFESITQDPKGGCRSTVPNTGTLTSPEFSLVGALTAKLEFQTWWEIEAVNANEFDVMTVEFSTDGGGSWSEAGKLNPVDNPAGHHDQGYSNAGLEQTPRWDRYVVDLSRATGSSTVRVRFVFDTVDELYQGFRGWLIDDVSVTTPFVEDDPRIDAITPPCADEEGAVVSLTGVNFVAGSAIVFDGVELPAAVLSATLIEFHTPELTDGPHTVAVKTPNGQTSNVVTLTSPCPSPPLSVSKSVAESQVSVGGSAVYTITVTNPNAVDAVLDSITDTLPSGFAHVAGSTSGATTADPSVAGEVLTWTGPFTVPATGELTLTFSASVGTTAGTFTNQADATATGFTVTGSGPTAAVTVVGNPTLSVGITGSGSVSSNPAGIACPGTCSAPFAHSTMVDLTPAAAAGWQFLEWSGACSGMTCSVLMDADKSVTATFVPVPRTLSVGITGSGSVSSSPAGIACPGTCSAPFAHSTMVDLTPAAAAGWQFLEWSGACSGMTCSVLMDADKSVTATFVPVPRTLSVGITGSGSVSSNPPGIACPGTCSTPFANSTGVQLTPTPAVGWRFSSWSGACSGDAACSVVMDADKSVTATFVPVSWTLSVGITGSGSVSSNPPGIACPGTCSAPFANSTGVQLTPTPAVGWRFSSWSGACSGDAACSVVMDADKSVTATFVPVSWTLSVGITGSGSVSSNPPGIACPGTCSAPFANSTGVQLTPTPAVGWQFSSWGGACSGSGSGLCSVMMDADKSVTATFTLIPTTDLRVQVLAPGSVGTGNPFNVGYVVSNLGTGAAPGSTLVATLGPNVVIAGPLPAGCSQPAGPTSVSCNLGTLAGGASTTVTLRVRSKVVGATCDVWGTSGNDTIVDSPGGHTICGLGGADTITAGSGADTIVGDNPAGARPFTATLSARVTTTATDTNPANNTASRNVSVTLGTSGGDSLSGGDGNDRIFAGPGNDSIAGGNDNDLIFADDGNDNVAGGEGNDEISGGDGNDQLSGNDGNDTMYGVYGHDTMNGGNGNDNMWGDSSASPSGGEGAGNDTMNGNAGNDTMRGQDGLDVMDGGSGNDGMNGGTGSDRLDGGPGSDGLDCGTGTDRYVLGPSDTQVRCEIRVG